MGKNSKHHTVPHQLVNKYGVSTNPPNDPSALDTAGTVVAGVPGAVGAEPAVGAPKAVSLVFHEAGTQVGKCVASVEVLKRCSCQIVIGIGSKQATTYYQPYRCVSHALSILSLAAHFNI